MTIAVTPEFADDLARIPDDVRPMVFQAVQRMREGRFDPLPMNVYVVDDRVRLAFVDKAWRLAYLELPDDDMLLLAVKLKQPLDEWLRDRGRFDTTGTIPAAALGFPESSGTTRVIAGFAGETTSGEDVLGITRDASALATLLASRSLQPPLALGLYGPWGSGKTFFMRTIENEIALLSQDGTGAFHQNVTSIWFNAWHYSEGNLWASLVHQIFLSLHGGESRAEEALRTAVEDIRGIQEVRREAGAEVRLAEERVAEAKDKVTDLESRRAEAVRQASEVTGKDVWAAVEIDHGARDQLAKVAGDLGLAKVGDSARDLAQAADEVRHIVRRAGLLATARPWWRSPLVLGLAVALVLAVGGVAITAAIDWSRPQLESVATTVTQIAALLGGAAAWLSRQAGQVRKLLAPAEHIQATVAKRVAKEEARHRRLLRTAEDEQSAAEAELADARAELATAKERQREAKAELDQLTGARLLERYLSERASSDDYRRHLGVIAQAHQDLRDLDEHLARAAQDETNESPVERIVLYIDDLDRCPPETVVRVLEAVHLLLALPSFVVVLGVDPEWLKAALRTHHLAAVPGLDGHATPADYLDKIFQLTYRLPAMDRDSCADLLERTALVTQPRLGGLVRRRAIATEPVEDRSAETTQAERPPAAINALVLGEDEIARLRAVAPLVGSSPRRAKRFLNVYRIAKVRALSDLAGSGRESLTEKEMEGLLVALAFLLGRSTGVRTALTNGAEDGLPLRTWLTSVDEDEYLDEFRAGADDLLSMSVGRITRWLPVVRRFT